MGYSMPACLAGSVSSILIAIFDLLIYLAKV